MKNNVAKKYSLSSNYILLGERKLYQIMSVVYVDMGEGFYLTHLGGYVESEHNLSHEGNCWIDENCCVFGNARVEGDAIVKMDIENNIPSMLGGDVVVKDKAKVVGSKLVGRQVIGGNSVINHSSYIAV